MRKSVVLGLIFLICATVMGCGRETGEGKEGDILFQEDLPREGPPQAGVNPFEEDGGNPIQLASIGHGPTAIRINEEGKREPFVYDGGEVGIEYEVMAEGDAKNFGFLVYLNGIPQPYKVEDTEAPYEYMHVFSLEKDMEPFYFSFLFTPVTGKEGEELELTIVSLFYPDYIPDMEETVSYGMYHSILSATYMLKMNTDAGVLPDQIVKPQELLLDTALSTEKITSEYLEKELSVGLQSVNMNTLNSTVFQQMYYDGRTVQDNLQVKDGDKLPISLKICGIPGVEYNTIFYVNHQPVMDKDIVSFETKLGKGNLCNVDVTLDVERLEEFNTFYAVSVPVNAGEYPDEVVLVLKTPSVLIYK